MPAGAACTAVPSDALCQSCAPVNASTAWTKPSCAPRNATRVAPGTAVVATAAGRCWDGALNVSGVQPAGHVPPAAPRSIACSTRSFELE